MPLEKDGDVNRNRNGNGNYQHVSDIIGSWGPLQINLFIMLTILYVPGPINNMGIILYSTKSPFWCSDKKTLEEPVTSLQCETQYLNQSCSSWIYNDTRKTIINEWDLVCDRRWLVSFTLSAYQIGYLISGPIFGLLSDTFGRRKALILSVVLEVCSSISSVISVTIYQFIAGRFFMGIAGYARYLSSILLLAESVGPKIRAKTIVGYDISYFIVKLLSTIVAYYIDNFRVFFLLVAIFEFTFLFWIYKIPESPLWQLINDQYEPAKKTIVKYSKKRGEDESQVLMKLDALHDFLSTRKNDELHSKKPSIFGILKHWILFKLILILCFIWFVAAYINYGITIALRDLTGNIYINSLVMCVADIISNSILCLHVEKLKRRTILGLCQLATGIMFLFMTSFVSSNEHLIFQAVFIMIGKFFSGIIFIMVYVYTPEIFPTSVRQFSVGLCSVISRLASISSAFIPEIIQATSIEAVFILFGGIALIGAGLTYFLFETKGKEMPNTVEEMIDLQKENQN